MFKDTKKMKTKNIKSSNILSITIFLLGSIGLVSVMALDKLYWRTDILAEGWPQLYTGKLVRSLIILISIFALLWSLIGGRKPKSTLDKINSTPWDTLFILVAFLVSSVILALFIFEPSIFNDLSLEDGPIEWGSALFLFGSCIITTISLLKSRYVLNIQKTTKLSLAFLSLVFFVMAMEEVSWFQRVLEIDTPKAFDANLQDEMNLHNFATDYIENIYYFGAFLFLVVLPFLRFLFPYISSNDYLRIFVPRPFIGVIGSIACAYNFDMWNVIFTQIAFFGSIVILFVFAIFSSNKNEQHVVLFAILLIAITQVLFLVNGENFARLWEVTEYKELLIPLALFIYSWDQFTHINRLYLLGKS
jgi:hypothetical protein